MSVASGLCLAAAPTPRLQASGNECGPTVRASLREARMATVSSRERVEILALRAVVVELVRIVTYQTSGATLADFRKRIAREGLPQPIDPTDDGLLPVPDEDLRLSLWAIIE